MSGPTPRIMKETEKLGSDPVPGIKTDVNKGNFRHFYVQIIGPEGTPYETELYLPEDYPMTSPKVVFSTKIYHPNIDNLDKWSPALQIRSVLLSIQALIADPNFDDPLNNEAVELWKKNKSEFEKKGMANKS